MMQSSITDGHSASYGANLLKPEKMEDLSTDSQALPAGSIIQEFEIERVLGAGGFGITYIAKDMSLGRQVVIKENLPSQFSWRETSTGTVRPRNSSGGDLEDFEWSLNNFLREAETLASLDHPGIVRVLRKFEANGTAYFVMPYVDGIPLDALVDERNSHGQGFTENEIHGMTSRLLAALGYLHERGIYHRDIKPGNILVTIEGVPVLIDFGPARQRISERSMTVIESAGYTPFEQLQSKGNVGPWSDLYSLGATLVKTITYETPPKAADRVMDDPWEGLVNCSKLNGTYSEPLLRSIEKAMSVSPANRWQASQEWVDELNNPSANSTTQLEKVATQQAAPKAIPAAEQIPETSSEQQESTPHKDVSRPSTSANATDAESAYEHEEPLVTVTDWRQATLNARCPSCGSKLSFGTEMLKPKAWSIGKYQNFTCPSCNTQTSMNDLGTIEASENVNLEVSVAKLLFSYSGRANRRTFWLLGFLPLMILLYAAAWTSESSLFVVLIWFFWVFGISLPLYVRRLHDTGTTGYLVLLLFIPYLGFILMVIMGFFPGNKGFNMYGPPHDQMKYPWLK